MHSLLGVGRQCRGEHGGALVGGADGARKAANSSRPVPSARRGAPDRQRRAANSAGVDERLERAGVGVEPDQVAVAQPGQRAAGRGLGRDVDGGRDLAPTRRTSGRR